MRKEFWYKLEKITKEREKRFNVVFELLMMKLPFTFSAGNIKTNKQTKEKSFFSNFVFFFEIVSTFIVNFNSNSLQVRKKEGLFRLLKY